MVTIDVGGISDERMLHLLLKRELRFPDVYGMDWAASWDPITGLVALGASVPSSPTRGRRDGGRPASR
ncbi:barstar family protein [Streptomyces rishiriensis]|uniref:barstar family protein n=1 Tax=Streptomyces rishiriensis TaxID=68264 RepID=UPI0027D8C7A4|nr:barstar family protein [Streptomyces rishiriensis]